MPRASRATGGICIAGMHRTGTSMIARLLHRSGLYLGPEAELVPPAPDNPEGFWENIHFVGINELILRTLGGTWDQPPPFPRGWVERPELEDLRLAARHVIGRLSRHRSWGWKDPRNSLTLPFWLQLLPRVEVIACIRNPLEVARSLHARDGTSIAAGLDLWDRYYRQLLRHVPPRQRIVTDYAAYFVDPAAELDRLTTRLRLRPSPTDAAQALRTIGPGLRHQHATALDLEHAGARADTIVLYQLLLAEAYPPSERLEDAPRPHAAAF